MNEVENPHRAKFSGDGDTEASFDHQ